MTARRAGASAAIEPIGALDLDDLARLHAGSFEEPWSRDAFARVLAATESYGLIARDGAAATGFALCRVVADECEILTFVVAPRFRRHGIGSALLDAALARAAARGARFVFLEVAEDNVPARALYAGAGFRRVGVREGYYRRGASRVDAWTLKRTLVD